MKVIVNKTCATVSGAEMLTSGMVGKTIDVEFSADWLGLIKIAVFTNGETTRDVLDPNGTVIIPWEVLATPNKRASVGFYGYRIENGEKVLAIPTVWAELGAVRAGADPSGDPSAELSPTVAEQLQSDVNNLDDRVTELEEHGGGGGTSDHSQLTNRDAANQHPMSAITGLENALDSKGTYTKPSGGIPKTDLASGVQTSLGKADSALQAADLNGYATEQYVNNHHDSTKQDVISDLDTIRSGAALGATALQTAPVSSVNGKTGAVNLVPSDLGIGSVFALKGSKPTYADLPATGNTIGDVWYVVANSVGYIWLNDGTTDRWEQLGMEIDLSAYRTSAAQDVIDNSKALKTELPTFGIDPEGNVYSINEMHIAAQYDDELNDIAETYAKKTELDDYALKTDLDELQTKTITDTAGYFTTDTVEGALEEIGAELAGINTLIGSGVIT